MSDSIENHTSVQGEGVGSAPGLSPLVSWQDQDPVLRDMWMAMKTPQEISDVLGRSVSAIMTRAARLGLPRRAAPGRKPSIRRTDGMGALPTTPSATVRPKKVQPREVEVVAMPVTTSPRVCLMCLSKFQSLGRHNRICPSCKGSSEYETAASLPEISVTF